MAAEQFTIERLEIDGTEIKGLVNVQVDPGLVQSLNAGASELDPSIVAITGSRPIITGQTADLGTLLPLMTTDPTPDYVVPHVPIATACYIWLQALADGGTRGGAGTNTKLTITKGILVPTTLSNSGEGIALCGFQIYADFDGTNAPVQFTLDQNLEAGGAGAATLWTIRALKNGSAGTVLHRLANIELDFGVEVQRHAPQNSIYVYDSAAIGFAPVLRWRTGDVATHLAASGFAGAVAAAGGMLVYIGKYDAASAGVKTTEAMTLAFTAGSPWWTDGLTLTNGQLVLADYQCHGQGGDTLASPPLTLSSVAASLPSETTDSSLYMAGPVVDNATEIEYQTGRLDFGLDWRLHRHATLPWPVHGAIMRREPRWQITTTDPDYVAGLGIKGRAVNTIFKSYLRRVTEDGEAYADDAAGTLHTLLSAAAGWIAPGPIGAAHNELMTPQVVVTPTGGLTIDTSVDIT